MLPQVPALPDAVAVAADVAAITTAVVELAGPVLPVLPAAPVVEPISESTPQPPVKASANAPQVADITPEAPDTAAAEPSLAEPVAPDKPPVAAAAVQVQPVNVNVSVRIASPGDDGAVTQLNASVADVEADDPAPVATAPTQGLVAASQPSSIEAQPSSTAGSLSGPVEQTIRVQPDTWTWNWNCRDSPSDIPELASALSGALPKNWNWNWNCGEDIRAGPNATAQLPSQYQAAAAQYQPVNINVSVRIASAGNNGPVVQTNLALTVASAVTASSSSESPPSGLPPPVAPPGPVVVSVEVATAPAAPAAAFEAFSALTAVAFELARGEETALEEVDQILRAGLFGWRRDDSGRHVVAAAEQRRIPDRLPSPPMTLAVPAIPLPHSPLAVSKLGRADTATRPAAAAEHPRRAVPPPPAPLPSLPDRVPLATLSLGGAAPGTGGDSGFLFLLLIPFAFALAEAARCVARDRPAIVAQVESSRRERPG